jgi:heme iron utilization protein
MPVEEPGRPNGPAAAPDARRLMRTALTGSLATLERDSGHPYASLVLVATAPDATPIFLLSRLAQHTRNLDADARASLLLADADDGADPLAASRLTLVGSVVRLEGEATRRRFLARHPAAAGYAGFADFAIYALAVARGHYIGGFGRIVTLKRGDLLAPAEDAAELCAAEGAILEHMNSAHADAVALYATALAGQPPGPWRMAGVDPDGADLLHCTRSVRIGFPQRVRTPAEARAAFAVLARQARAEQAGSG